MKIFLSWSGDRSRAVAEALKEFLPVLSSQIKPFFSKKDIAPGTRPILVLARELEESDFGILCLTPENIKRPWIIFEAGAISKKVIDSAAVPYLFGLKNGTIEEPLGQFQGLEAKKEPTFELAMAINAKLTPPEPESILRKRFEGEWPHLEAKLDAIPKHDGDNRATKDIPPEVAARIEELVRDLAAMKEAMAAPRPMFVYDGLAGHHGVIGPGSRPGGSRGTESRPASVVLNEEVAQALEVLDNFRASIIKGAT